MKTKNRLIKTMAFPVIIAVMLPQATTAAEIVVSLQRNGQIGAVGLEPGTKASVEWASSIKGPWSSSWEQLKAVTVRPDGSIQVPVPMFYRVSGTPANPNPAELAWIPPGSFMMGSPPDEQGREEPFWASETQHEVTLTRGFWMGRYEVTIAQYRTYLQKSGDLGGVDWGATSCPLVNKTGFPLKGNNVGQSEEQPMVEVTWYGAVNYCRWLTEREQEAGRLPSGYEYDLPTEAQWEYACRAGTRTRFSFGEALSCVGESGCSFCADMDPFMWWCGNSSDGTQAVGQKPANSWGLFDMHGNADEWCSDWLGDYPFGSVVDPSGPPSGTAKIHRGGNWRQSALKARSAYRIMDLPTASFQGLGFRVVLEPVP